MRRFMLRMVSVEGGVVRRRVSLDELKYDDPEETKRATKVRNKLESARLITAGGDADGNEFYIEPSHDALITSWKSLTTWTREAMAQLLLHRRITQAARAKESGKGALWPGNDPNWPTLSRFSRPSTSSDVWLSSSEARYLNNSFAARLLGRAAALSLMLIVMVALVVTFLQLREVALARQTAKSEAQTRIAEIDCGECSIRNQPGPKVGSATGYGGGFNNDRLS